MPWIFVAGLQLLGACQTFAPPDVLWSEALARFDRDGDGMLSRADYGLYTAVPGAFEDIDTSGDGEVDVDELRTFTLTRPPRSAVPR